MQTYLSAFEPVALRLFGVADEIIHLSPREIAPVTQCQQPVLVQQLPAAGPWPC